MSSSTIDNSASKSASWKRKIVRFLGKSGGKHGAKSKEDANVVVGPVIGKVSSSTARILLEIDRDSDITVVLTLVADSSSVLRERSIRARRRRGRSKLGKQTLVEEEKRRTTVNTSNGGEVVIRLTKKVGGNRPFVFQFTGLTPSSRYRVDLEGCKPLVSSGSSFCTFPDDPNHWDRLNVGVVSCNKIFITQMEIPIHSDLWAHLARNVQAGNVDLLLHLGDQVYGDGDKLMDKQAGEAHDKWSDRFRLCKEEVMKDCPRNLWQSKQEQVCEEYREVYRQTWQHLPTAQCLANCPNLMIYDDHEVRDNWADLPEDWDPECLDFFIARCAWIVYLEYQRQLDRDIDFRKLHKFTKDHHFHVVGGLGIMFLDVRGCRSFQRVNGDEFPYLGSTQWGDVDQSLAPGGEFDGVRLLLVCSPAPLVFLEPKITDAAGKNVGRLVDFRGHWSADIHRKEQTRMIDALVGWMNSGSNSGKREVMVLGGDVHCGGHSHILKDGEVIFNQLTTSAIANRPLPKAAYYFMRAAGRLGDLGNYKFRHHHWTRSRNYGLMNIKNYRQQDAGNVEILSQLIIGKFVGGIIKGEVIRSSTNVSVKCGCFEAGV